LVDLLWLNKMDYMLSDNRMLDKFHVVNRMRSKIADVLDMSYVRTLFFRVQDFFQEMDYFILEKYHIPSNYQELQRRM
jgi:hypothetical protein